MADNSENPMEMMIGGGVAVSRDTESSHSHFVAGHNAETLGERWGAISEYRMAIQYDPENTDAMFRLAYNLDLVGEEDESLSLYERCCEQSPAYVNVLLNLAISLEDRGYYRKAEKCLRQILDTDPNHERARLYMKDVIASFDMEVDEDTERDAVKRNAMLDIPVSDFELSVRARNCLKKMNIRSLGDLLRSTESELLGYKNFGETSLVEIKEMLTAKGLRLGQALENQQDMIRRAVYERLKGTPQEHLLDKPVAELDLSVRARKAIQMLGIMTIGDLCSRTEAELLGIKNFGTTSLIEVNEKLTNLGLALRQLDSAS